MTDNMFDFSEYDQLFHEVPESTGFELIPVGKYHVLINTVEVKVTTNGKPKLSWDFVIQDGECADRHVFHDTWLPCKLDTPEKAATKLGMAKRDFRMAGVKTDNPKFNFNQFINSGLHLLQDKPAYVEVKHEASQDGKSTYAKAYFLEMENAPAPVAVETAPVTIGTGTMDYDPFAEE